MLLFHIRCLTLPVDAEGWVGDAVIEGVSRKLIIVQRIAKLHIVGIAATNEHIRLSNAEGERINFLSIADDLRLGIQSLDSFLHTGKHLACAHSHVVHGFGGSFWVGEVCLHRQHIAHQINDVAAGEMGSGLLIIAL